MTVADEADAALNVIGNQAQLSYLQNCEIKMICKDGILSNAEKIEKVMAMTDRNAEQLYSFLSHTEFDPNRMDSLDSIGLLDEEQDI
jgi:uncharacterized membrane protein